MKQENTRNSNLELLRILAMLLIISHHYVVNSTIMNQFNPSSLSGNMIFLQLAGIWGKPAINIFILISGYFMCKSSLTWKKVLKLFLEIKFYHIIMFFIMALLGYQPVSFTTLFDCIFSIVYGINNGFTASFFAFYMFLPFYNILIQHMSEREHKVLIFGLLFMFTIAGTFFGSTSFNEVGWYITLYILAAYFRLYPNKFTESAKFNGVIFVVATLASWGYILLFDVLHLTNIYYFVADSHKILAFILGVSAFLWFKNLKIPKNKKINQTAATCFGILLIHSDNLAMREFLWQDVLHVPEMFTAPFLTLICHYIFSVLLVFIICSFLDRLRIHFLERPVMEKLCQKWPVLNKKILED